MLLTVSRGLVKLLDLEPPENGHKPCEHALACAVAVE